MMIHGTKKWSILTAAVLLALGSLAFLQTAWAANAVSGTSNEINRNGASANSVGTAVGDGASAKSDGTEVGWLASAGEDGTAVGDGASAGEDGTAVGSKASAGKDGTAVGWKVSVEEAGTAVGALALAKYNGTALGLLAWAMENGTTVGAMTLASENGTAVGTCARAIHSYSVALGNGSVTKEDNSVSVGGGTDVATRTITNVTAGDSANDAATWDQIAKTGQTVSLWTETTGEGDDVTVTKHNQLVANDGTVLATFKEGTITNGDTGFVSGGTVYDYLQNAGTGQSLAGSDSITISSTDNKIRVANMAQSTSDTLVQNEGTIAKGAGAMAFGAGSWAFGSEAVAIGNGNTSDGDYSATFGYSNEIDGSDSYALGKENEVYGNQSTAIGYKNTVGIALSVDESGDVVPPAHSGENSYVFGSNNEVMADNAFVFGSGITVSADAANSVVLGNGSMVEEKDTVSVGSAALRRKIVHVASGSANTDAANFGQLITAKSYNATSSDITKAQTVTLTSNDGASSVSISIAGEGQVAAGDARLVSGDTVFNYIKDNISGGSSGSAADVKEIKENITTESGTYIEAGTDVGKNLKALDSAIGEVKAADGESLNVITSSNEDGTKTSVAENLMKLDEKIGSLDSSRDPESNARAMKYNVISSRNTISENLEALDDATTGATANLEEIAQKLQYEGASVTGEKAIGLGQGSEASGANAISFGTGAAASKENALAFGNGAKASEANTLAFGNGAAASSENAMAFGNGASAMGSGSVAIGSGSTATEDNVVSFGAEGSERRLTNVAAGVNDTDAVNVGQMNSAIGENFNYLKSSLTRDINKVAAGSAALAALRPEGFDPDDKFSMAVGFGHYKNANAGAIGAFYKPNYDTTFSIGATLGDGESMMNMGVSFKLGSRGKRTLQTGEALSQEVASLRKDNESLKKDNASQATAIKEQAKEIADLKADNERMKEQIAMILAKMELSDTVEKSVVK